MALSPYSEFTKSKAYDNLSFYHFKVEEFKRDRFYTFIRYDRCQG